MKGSHAIEGRGILDSPSWVFGAVPGTDPLMAWRTISSKSLGTLRVERRFDKPSQWIRECDWTHRLSGRSTRVQGRLRRVRSCLAPHRSTPVKCGRIPWKADQLLDSTSFRTWCMNESMLACWIISYHKAEMSWSYYTKSDCVCSNSDATV